MILVTGSLAIDRIAVFHGRFADHILPHQVHRLSVAFPIKNMTENFGGTGGNIAYNLGILGEKPILLSTVGKDGGKYIAWLKKNKIDCRYVKKIPKVLTAHATIMTDMDDNQITAFYEGAMAHAPRSAPRATLGIIAPNDTRAMLAYANGFRKKRIPFVADPGQAISALSKEELVRLMKGAHVLICNDYEWEMILEKTKKSHADLLSLVDYLIVTYGEAGSKVWKRGSAEVTEVPIYKVKDVVDPTGCGDALRAGVLYGLSHGHSIVRAAHIGSWLAARAVTKQGTQNHCVSKSEFQRFMKTI